MLQSDLIISSFLLGIFIATLFFKWTWLRSTLTNVKETLAKNWKITFLSLFLFLLGLFVGICGRDLVGLSFKKEFDIFDIFTLLVAIGIALAVQYYAQGKQNDLRKEKDLLIEQARKITDILPKSEDIFLEYFEYNKNIDQSYNKRMVPSLRRLGNEINHLEDQIKTSKLIAQKNNFSDLKKAYDDYRYQLLNLTFSRPISPQTEAEKSRLYRKLYEKVVEFISTVNSN